MKKRGKRGSTINSKISFIQGKVNSGDKLLTKYFSDDLLGRLLLWKDERNRMIHALLKQQFEHNEIAELATKGNELVKALRSKSGSYNRAIEKAKALK